MAATTQVRLLVWTLIVKFFANDDDDDDDDDDDGDDGSTASGCTRISNAPWEARTPDLEVNSLTL